MRIQLDQEDRASLPVFLLLLFCLRGDANEPQEGCVPQVQVRRDTVVTTVEKQALKIICPVKDCEMPLTQTWCRVNNANNCVAVNQTGHIKYGEWEKSEKGGNLKNVFLYFANITMEDAGQYRCEISSIYKKLSSVGHFITVKVTAMEEANDHVSSNDTTTSENNVSMKGALNNKALDLQPYIFICVGIMALVVMVTVISFLGIQGCKRSVQSAKASPPPCQYETPKTSGDASLRPSLPAKRSPVLHHMTTDGAPPPRNSHLAVDMDSSSRDDRENSIIYASLNHHATPDGPVRTSIPMDDFSEYAAIRYT